LIEFLVVAAIISLLILATLFGVQLQLMRARDAHRKADLEKLKVAFEHYYSDNDCYPDYDIFYNGGVEPDPAICGQAIPELTPYLNQIPCDPETGLPYAYYPPEGKTSCEGYRLYTKLENDQDQGIANVGCSASGCGGQTSYNYGVSVGGSLIQQTGSVAPTSAPTVTPEVVYNGEWVCSPNSDPNINGGEPYCKQYTNPIGHGCGASYPTESECDLDCYTGSWITCSD